MREVKQSSTGADKGFPKPKYVSEVICNQFTEDAYLQCIVCTSCLALLVINKAQLEICFVIYEAQETLYLHS